jgi:beta-glucosidase/6-phospho-beta-glucosidase/beta-galactosidase
MFTHLGGFESTQMFGTGQDVLGTTRHVELWREDLVRLLRAGIRELRYSIPWHRIEARPGIYDWRWIDQPLRFMEANGMVPIADPLHHTSFPPWLTDGFLNPEFPARYQRFISHVCQRYPFIRKYTVFNEPLPTTLFCSYTGMWYPHLATDRDFVRMSLQVTRAISRACETLQQLKPEVTFVHVDTAEHHQSLDRKSVVWTNFANQRRFLLTDLALGRVKRDHELYDYLLSNGATADELMWFEDHPGQIHILGLDYYVHCEMLWSTPRTEQTPVMSIRKQGRRGFANIAEDYIERYKFPVMLSETNLRGTVVERIAWLKMMEAECEELAVRGRDFRGFCWYPSIDTTDWWNACTQATGVTDPQGIWSLDPKTMQRVDTELSEFYTSLAKGKSSSAGNSPEEQPGFLNGHDFVSSS